MLALKNIKGGYINNSEILNGINLQQQKGEVLGILGQNGSGKSTLAKAIINALPMRDGQVLFQGEDISKIPTHNMPKLGITSFAQGGSIFPNLSVKQHLKLVSKEKDLFLKQDAFNILEKYQDMEAGMLSGGERNTLALAMALVHQPKLIILDEPTAGLSPVASNRIYAVLETLKQKGLSIILIEQNIQRAIYFCDKVIILENGTIVQEIQNKNYKETLRQVEELFFE